jgi:hypothetical protein
MSCPYLKEVVMLFCDAYAVKKMLPLDRLATAHPCLGHEFERCPVFQEIVARIAKGECAEKCTVTGSDTGGRHAACLSPFADRAGADRTRHH